jgi:hypothetical protein
MKKEKSGIEKKKSWVQDMFESFVGMLFGELWFVPVFIFFFALWYLCQTIGCSAIFETIFQFLVVR